MKCEQSLSEFIDDHSYPTIKRRNGLTRFNHIPKISIQVFKNKDSSIGFFSWWFNNPYLVVEVGLVIPLQVVGVKKHKDSSACLVAYPASLFVIRGFCQ